MLNFTKCQELISKGRNGSKKLKNNTYLDQLDDNTFGVRLHNTYVVKINRDGTYTLNSGGWRTSTTKDRINEYSPVYVFQRAHIWFVDNGKPFTDGMTVGTSAPVPVASGLFS